MKLYSPFVNEKHEFLSINDVTYIELDQLSTLDEGYQLEFKLNLNENVKKKIPSIITSFANSSGGWIIIGIEDKSKQITPIKRERNDFGQIISQLLKGHVTPIPQYEVRFLECPNDTECGVLLIYVSEGNYSPYISDGTIYIRNGNSKEPVQRADRATIELLLGKGNQYKNSVETFFSRDIYFPYNNLISKSRDYSLCNIYLKTLSDINIFGSYQEQEDIKNSVIQDENSIFQCAQFDLNSIIFKHKAITPFNNGITMLYDLYGDTSAKIYIPLAAIEGFDKKYATTMINKLFPVSIDENAKYKLIDGITTIDSIWAVLSKHIKILKNKNIKITDLALQIECEDIENTILYFENPLYFKYIEENGLCYSQRKIQKTKIIYLKDCEGIEFEQLAQAVAFDLFAYIFGFNPDKAFDIHQEALRIRYPDLQENNIS